MTGRDFDDFEHDDELRHVVRATAGTVRDGSAADVLGGLRPRLTSARRRYVATRVTAISSLLVMAIGLTAAVNASVPAGHIKVQAPAASTLPDATSIGHGATTSSAAAGNGAGSAGRDTTTTSSVAGHSPKTTVPRAPTATVAPGSTTPDTTDSTTPASTPNTTPGGPEPTSTPTTTPPVATTTTTSPVMQSKVFHTTAGDVTVSWDATRLVVDSVDPASGWSYTTHYDDVDEVTVYFSRLSPPSAQHLHLELQGGHPVVDS